MNQAIHARKRGHQDLPDEDKADEVRIEVAEAPLGEVHEQYLFAVHDLTEVEGRFFLRDDGPHDLVRKEVVELGDDIGHDVLERRFPAGLLRHFGPELRDDRVLTAREFERAEFFAR